MRDSLLYRTHNWKYQVFFIRNMDTHRLAIINYFIKALKKSDVGSRQKQTFTIYGEVILIQPKGTDLLHQPLIF